ncbi:ATP-binding protein [Sphingomonas sp.]|jgi:molecular chaperone HtpG|uniref:ATP-binding protein n=1 Tax=Sphingomonas sp. TaxID=28214 RepID=UPI003564DB95
MVITRRAAPKSKGRPVPEPLIGSFLLESITTGMYGERKNAIREYVQNSFDGIQSAIDAKILRTDRGKITITMGDDGASLVIHDNGIGLPQRIAVGTLTAVGASRKERGRQAGFRGIGRLAGIAFSRTLQFRTKAAGEDLETIVWFDCDALRRGMLESGRKPAVDLITSCTTFDQMKATDAEAHYFEVSLLGLRNAPVEALDALQLESFLAQVAPVDYHPDFRKYRDQILGDAAELAIPEVDEADEDDDPLQERPDWTVLEDDASSMLERIPVSSVALAIKSSETAPERLVHKPYRMKLGVNDSPADVPIAKVDLIYGASGAWWGWIGHKTKPGEYQDGKISGIRFRLKNIQIDGNELITLVPTTNEIRQPFSRWSNWFVGEIHVDPRAVVPNARRDNFEEDARWLEIRGELSTICSELTREARDVSKAHQMSVEMLDKKAAKLRKDFLTVSRANPFSMRKAQKLLQDSDSLQKLIEKASGGAPAVEQVRFKAIAKEVTQIRVGLLEKPQTSEYGQFRSAIREEFLSIALSVLNDFLDIELYEEVRETLEKRLPQ